MHTEAGLAPDHKVAILLPNCTEYLETFIATRKLRCAPLNVGTDSSVDALHKTLDATDSKVVVCSPATAQAARDASRRIPKRWRPVIVETGVQYERGIASAVPPAEWEIETPSADDLIFFATHNAASGSTESRTTLLAAASLARGNGLAEALGTLSGTGSVVFVDSPGFDPQLVWQTVAKESVETLTIGGDAFARPLLAALPKALASGSLTTLRTISSSGARLSPDVASALKAALVHVNVLDSYDAAEQQAPAEMRMIHPSEVEAKLRKHSSISDCVVVGISDPRTGKQVVAVVQVSDDHYLDAAELAAWCRAHVPSSMTPGRFVFVERIERSPTGEADYQGLRGFVLERLVADPRGTLSLGPPGGRPHRRA